MGRTRGRRRRPAPGAGASAVAFAVWLAGVGCSQDPERVSTSPPAVVDLGPGAPIEEGFVVPEGTELAGAPFDLHMQGSPRTWGAVLRVTGPPVAVWNDVLRQAGALGFGTTDGGAPCSRPEGDWRHLRCSLEAWKEGRHLEAILMYGVDQATLAVKVADLDPADERPPGVAPVPVDEAVAAGVAPPSVVSARVGDPVGEEHNCFDYGYDRFRLPPGSAVLVPEVEALFDFTAMVLAVTDPELVMRHLLGQLTKSSVEVRELQTPGGDAVLYASYAVDAGGGLCTLQTSRDRRTLLVTMHSD